MKKLSPAQLKDLYLNEGYNLRQLARMQSVHETQISEALRGMGLKLNPGCSEKPIDIEEMYKLYLNGMTMKQLAKVYSCSIATIHTRFKRHKLKAFASAERMPLRTPESLYRKIQKLYWDEGMSINQVAVELKLDRTSVLHHMRNGGIPRRTRSEAQKLMWANRAV